MKDGGPLAAGNDYGVQTMRETLKCASCPLASTLAFRLTSVSTAASSRAETIFQPIVDARTKAERLKSTLGVFERSKFFFNLPTILGEAVEEVHRLLSQPFTHASDELPSTVSLRGRAAGVQEGPVHPRLSPCAAPRSPRPDDAATATAAEAHLRQGVGTGREDHWRLEGDTREAVEGHEARAGRGREDDRVRLFSFVDRQRGPYSQTFYLPRRILLELDPSDDPAWIFFDTQHRHILQLLRTSAEASMSRIRVAMDQYGEAEDNDRKQAADLGAGVASLESLDGERIRGACDISAPVPSPSVASVASA